MTLKPKETLLPEEFYEDETKYLLRRDELYNKGYSLSFSYDRETATALEDVMQDIISKLRTNGFVVAHVSCDKQTALYYKHD